jgi:hypothetical protein
VHAGSGCSAEAPACIFLCWWTGVVEQNKQKPDLELTEDFTFEQREWKVQRVAWLIMALAVLLGLLGLLGPGPISSRTITSTDGTLRLEYNRFQRYQAPSTLHLQLQATGQTKARVWIARQFVEKVKLEAVQPPPERVDVLDSGLVYTFSVPRGQPSSAVFHLQTQEIGANPLRLRLNEGAVLEVPYWVYP